MDGIICVIGQILIDKTKLTPAKILVAFVTTGCILGGLGIYKYLVDFAGSGATVPLTGFGYNLAKGAIEGVQQNGIIGAFTGGVKASAGGIAAAVFFRLFSFSYFKTKNEKTIKNQNLDAGYDVSGDPRKDWNYAVPQTVMDVLNGTNPYNTDAYDEIFQTAPQQSYNLSVQGGNEKIKYAVSGEYTSQEGIIVTNKFQRFSARANLDAKLSDRVSMKFNMNSTYSNGRNILASGGAAESEGILGAATTWLKWYPLYNEDGSYFSGFGQDATNNVWNPLAQAYEIKRKNEQYRTLANLEMDIKIIEGLNFKAMLGANVVNRHKYSFIPKLDVFSNSSDGTDERSDRLNWITEWTMNYQKSFKKHNLSALVGYTTQKETNKSNYLRSMSYPNNLVYTLNAVSNDIYAGNSDEYDFYLTDRHNHAIRILSPLGQVTTYAGRGSASLNSNPWGYANGRLREDARFNRPKGIAWDERDNTIYVGDANNYRIRKIGLEEDVPE